ncbi:MAG: regulatory protein RecX [Bacteroidales bacterium]|jgi:regulatory protein|nr:regulatory protein RecX [Bacteroidales bacterium]
MNSENYRMALERAMALCSRSEKCRHDIMAKLKAWKLTGDDENASIIKELTAGKFIDEKRYAAAFTRDKIRFNKWGRIKIRAMLKSRGIGDPDIEHGLGAIDHDQYLQMIEEGIKDKLRTVKAGNTYELKGKLSRFASSRGYEHEYVFDIINRLTS